MAFDAAGLNCIGVGPTKLYIYNTADVMTSALVQAATSGFCKNNCPGMNAGDVVIVAHNTKSSLAVVRITNIAATTCTADAISALA